MNSMTLKGQLFCGLARAATFGIADQRRRHEAVREAVCVRNDCEHYVTTFTSEGIMVTRCGLIDADYVRRV